jgi:hypothetical protein
LTTIAIDSKNARPQNGGVTVPPIPSDAKRFRMALVPITVFIFISGLVLGYALALSTILLKEKSGSDWHELFNYTPIVIPFLMIYAFAIALAISLIYPCCVAVTGIYGHSFWGLRSYLGWSDISAAKKTRLGNLVFLKLCNKAGRAVIWLPLFLSRRVEFQEAIRKFAPPGHPVLSHLD